MKKLLLLLLIPTLVWAEEPVSIDPFEVRFGAEWTFSSDELLESFPNDGTNSAKTALSELKILEVLGVISKKLMSFQIEAAEFHNGFSRSRYNINWGKKKGFRFFSDPGALEVNTAPLTEKQFEKRKEYFQKVVFDSMAEADLTPQAFTGSGHIHIEIANLPPLVQRNLIVDFFNHSGLFAGGLNDDQLNAISYSELPATNKQRIRKILDRKNIESEDDLLELIFQLSRNGYSLLLKNDPYQRNGQNMSRSDKYHALSFKSYSSLGTLEVRGIRPQASAESYHKLMQLFQRRIRHIAKISEDGTHIPLILKQPMKDKPQVALKDLYHYVTEVGLDFEDYREFVLPWWQLDGGEFDQFKKTQQQCEKLFLSR